MAIQVGRLAKAATQTTVCDVSEIGVCITYRLRIDPPGTALLTDLAQAARVLGLRVAYRNWTWIVEPHT